MSGVAPTTNFPALIVDWGISRPERSSLRAPPSTSRCCPISPRDTDEFDQHVVAHEFGHYIEHNFSRADNIGGSHGLGDKLDPRVAFGEGFGYAFAAIVLNGPDARDSGKNNSDFFSTNFPIEDNPQTNPVGAPNDDYGCWCSESSVWSILWDLYDTAADANDTLALGFAPMWQVLTGPQRTTPAFTTIFPFITALKVARPGDAAPSIPWWPRRISTQRTSTRLVPAKPTRLRTSSRSAHCRCSPPSLSGRARDPSHRR